MEHKLAIYNTFGFHRDIFLNEPVELWIDLLPNQPKTCKRVLLLAEPDEISNLECVITGPWQFEFDLILTHNQNILEKCPNSVLHEFGTCWIKDFQFNEKKYAVSTLIGGKKITPNHSIRHQLISLLSEKFGIELDFYNSSNIPFSDSSSLLKLKNSNSKNELFDYQYHIVIENCSRENFFSEKLIDCLQTKTIPIYLGCPNINEWFDTNGFFIVNSFEEINNVLSKITPETYESKLKSINYNFEESKKFCDFGEMIENQLKNFYSDNSIIL